MDIIVPQCYTLDVHGLTDTVCIPLCRLRERASVLICGSCCSISLDRVTAGAVWGRIMTNQRRRQTPVIKGDAYYTEVGQQWLWRQMVAIMLSVLGEEYKPTTYRERCMAPPLVRCGPLPPAEVSRAIRSGFSFVETNLSLRR